MMDKFLASIESLAFNYPTNISLYRPAALDDITRVKSWFSKTIKHELDDYLVEFCKYSDGIGMMDYAFSSCANKRMPRFIDDNKFLWTTHPKLSHRFIVFMGNSGGERFGYFPDFRDGLNPVGYLNTSYFTADEAFIISSSVECFLNEFFTEVKNTLSNTKVTKVYSIESDDWPTNLNYWYSRDRRLKALYEEHQIVVPGWITENFQK